MTESNQQNGTHVDVLPSHTTCDVAIVGYGPVGMIFATLMALQGLRVVVVEKHRNRYQLSRAGHFDGEIMRVFQRLGVSADMELIAQTGLSYELLTPQLDVLQKINAGQSGLGWKQDYLCSSIQMEKIINARALELGVRVFMETTAEAFTEENHRAVLTVRRTGNPQAVPSTIDAAYVVGADGANSFMRGAMNVKRHDLGFDPVDNLVLDFEHNDPDRDIPDLKECYQILDIRRPQLAGRWGGTCWSRFEFVRLEGESREHLENEATCWEFLARWHIKPQDGKIVRRSIYTFESTMTDTWRVGRALLVGDAAHTMPPFMGQGMCSGIRDALNLSWKLSAVIRGEADDSLLNTYQLERESHVRAFTDMSMTVGRLVLMTDPEEAARRDQRLRLGTGPRPAPFPRLVDGIVRRDQDASNVDGRPGIQGRVAFHSRVDRLDEFLRPGWKIIARHRVHKDMFDVRQQNLISVLKVEFAHVSRGAQPDSDSFLDIDGDYDGWFIKTGKKVIVQRPDNYIFGTAKTMEDLPTLLNELGDCLVRSGWRGLQY